MNKVCFLKFGIFVFVVAIFAIINCQPVYAANAGGDVFGKLSTLGGTLGIGLARVGYLIAGVGLIAFSVAAIFNKISWKTLAYIMMSTFILTMLLSGAIYKFLGAGSDYGVDKTTFNGSGGSVETGQDTTKNRVDSGHK